MTWLTDVERMGLRVQPLGLEAELGLDRLEAEPGLELGRRGGGGRMGRTEEEEQWQFLEQRHSSELVWFDNGKRVNPIFIMTKLQISRLSTILGLYNVGHISKCQLKL